MNSASPDAELITGLVSPAARREAASLLYQRYASRFMAYLRRRGLGQADAEDAVQEAFIRLIRRAETFALRDQTEPDRACRAWIWTVARSAWLDWRKRQGQAGTTLDDVPEGALGVVPDVAVTSNYQDCVHGQLARFAQDYPDGGEAILWAAVDGLKTSQIGELLGRSAGATREFLSQTRKRLRQYLAPCLES